jgi:hypothetical protein
MLQTQKYSLDILIKNNTFNKKSGLMFSKQVHPCDALKIDSLSYVNLNEKTEKIPLFE